MAKVPSNDRIVTLSDEKARILDLYASTLPVPSAAIYDSPVRYYKANKEWAVIIEGFCSWLADVAAWTDAQDKRYEPIQQILTFLEGIDLCQEIADCIENSEAVRDALREVLADTDNPVLPPSSLPVTPDTVIPVPSGYPENILEGCDKDNIYGLSKQVVELTYRLVDDAFQIIEAASNAIEAAIILADDVPLLSQSLDFLNLVQESAYEAFQGGFTEVVRQEIECELFCRAVDNCTLSIDDIVDFFGTRYLLPLPSSIETLIAQLSLIVSGEDWVNAMFALSWASISAGHKWMGIENVAQVSRLVASMYNDPDSDWEILCEDCSEEDELPACIEWNNFSGNGWEITFQYIGTVTENAVVDNAFGNNAPSAKAGFVTSGSNHGRYINVRVTFDSLVTVTSAAMQYWYNDAGNDSPRRRISLFNASGVALANQQLDTSGAPKSEWVNHEWTGDVDGVAYIEFNFRHWGTNTAIFNIEDTSAWLDNICMEVEAATPIAEYDHNFASDELITTPDLDSGKTYRIDTSGTGYYAGGGSWADAFYYDNSNPTPVSPVAYTGGGLQINGADASPYPSFNALANGRYSVTVSGVTSITTKILDGSYGNNAGIISIKIYEV